LLADLADQVRQDRDSISTFRIARTILTRLNDRGDGCIRERRELLRRVTEWEDFSTCWENNRLEAEGLVARVRDVVNVKDSFTRMKQERDREHGRHQAEWRARAEAATRVREERERIKRALYALFAEPNASARGRALEQVLNDLFKAYEIQVREAFTLRGAAGDGVIEQIDGVIQLDGHLYLVEMKWLKDSLGRAEVSEHLVRVYGRGDVRGLFVSYTDYTPAAIEVCREALHQKVVTLCRLQELVVVLDQGRDLAAFLRAKVNAAIIEKKPWFEPSVA
jgi:restriction endonuclease Mrr